MVKKNASKQFTGMQTDVIIVDDLFDINKPLTKDELHQTPKGKYILTEPMLDRLLKTARREGIRIATEEYAACMKSTTSKAIEGFASLLPKDD